MPPGEVHMRKTRWQTIGLGLIVCLAATASGCSSSPKLEDSARTTRPPRASSTSAVVTTTTAAVPNTTTTFVPMQTAEGGEFQSPSGNISCQVTDDPTQTSAYCVSGTPPQHVTMTPDGSFTTCAGTRCLSNAALGTPVLAYGSVTGVGPFRCLSATTGVICTVSSGRGFKISRSGISPISP